MGRRRVFCALPLTLVFGGCGDGPGRAPAARVPQQECDVQKGIRVDSAFAVEQARRALQGFLPTGGSLEPYTVEVVRQGMLISLVPRSSQGPGEVGLVLGGGGLVWVDRGTGCPIVLRWDE